MRSEDRVEWVTALPSAVKRKRSKSVVETEAFGEELGRSATKGQVIGLSGDLGAGKTALVRGLARGLGCTDRVHSPTFALVNEYGGGRLPLFHLDLYRLSSGEEIRAAGLEEYLIQPEGVCVAEWFERWETEGIHSPQTTSAPAVWQIRLTSLDEQTRDLEYDLAGA